MAFSKASNNDMDFSDQPPLYPMPNSDGTNSFGPPISPSDLPSHLRKNLSEKARLQGLMAGNRSSFLSVSSEGYGGSTSRVDLSRGVIIESKGTRFKSWMVNEGGRKFFIWTWIFIHIFSYICAFLNFLLKDNLTQARATFNITYPVARSAALVLHIDVAFILLPVCRNFITLMRRSALNHVIPFEKNITFHKFTGFALAFFTAVHVAAHMVNFTELAIKTETGIIGFIGANFLTGPGATGWIMTVALGIMVWYAREVPRRARFERFWYSHHLFIVLTITFDCASVL